MFVLAQLLNNGGIVVAKSIQQLRQEDLASNVSSHGASIDKEHIVWQTACMLSSAPTAVIPQESASGLQ